MIWTDKLKFSYQACMTFAYAIEEVHGLFESVNLHNYNITYFLPSGRS